MNDQLRNVMTYLGAKIRINFSSLFDTISTIFRTISTKKMAKLCKDTLNTVCICKMRAIQFMLKFVAHNNKLSSLISRVMPCTSWKFSSALAFQEP